MTRTDALTSPLLETTAAIGVALTLWAGLSRIVAMDAAQFLALYSALLGTLDPFRKLGDVGNRIGISGAAADRLFALLDRRARDRATRPDATPLPSGRGAVRFEDVRFSYPDGREALSGVTFDVEPGTVVAIVGPSGAGKSTHARPRAAAARPVVGVRADRGRRPAARDARVGARRLRHPPPATGPLRRHDRGQRRARPPRRVGARTSRSRPVGPTRTTSSRRSPTATRRGSARAGPGFRAASASDSRSRARSSPTRASCSSTSRRARSTARARTRCALALAAFLPGRTVMVVAHRPGTVERSDRVLVLRGGTRRGIRASRGGRDEERALPPLDGRGPAGRGSRRRFRRRDRRPRAPRSALNGGPRGADAGDDPHGATRRATAPAPSVVECPEFRRPPAMRPPAATAVKTVSLVAVHMDLGAGRRGVDMGPSAIRIAGIAERLTRLGLRRAGTRRRVRPRARGVPRRRVPRQVPPRDRVLLRRAAGQDPRDAGRRARSPSCSEATTRSRSAPSPRRRSTIARRGLPVGVVWIDAHADMNTPGVEPLGEHPRHAARGLPRAGREGADLDRGRPGGARSAARGAPRRARPRRRGASHRQAVGRALLHDVGDRRARHRGVPRRGVRPRDRRDGGRPPLVRPRRRRPAVRAGRRHAGPRRAHLPRGASRLREGRPHGQAPRHGPRRIESRSSTRATARPGSPSS